MAYVCKEKGAQHVSLKAVKHNLVLDLVKDSDFMGVCLNQEIQNKVVAAVVANKVGERQPLPAGRAA